MKIQCQSFIKVSLVLVREYNCKILLRKFVMVNQILNHNSINRAGVHDKGLAHSRVSVNSYLLISKHYLFRLFSWNFGTLHGRVGEIVKTLNRRKIEMCFVQDVQ